ncbi:MAG: rod shape-determining protein MreC [Lachnospiraceae bacterium]|nr:rod shape-determining protein MreC [Lachnospiraceae bacterium]
MNRKGSGIPSRYILAMLSIVCIVLLFTSYAADFSAGPIQFVANYVFVPMQKGLNFVGNSISVNSSDAKSRAELVAENESLNAQVAELTSQITNMQLQQSELYELQKLFKLDQQYGEYEKVGAHVIAKSTNNWFDTFTIDKGADDGIKIDMNVMADSGLVGIVTDVGPGYAVVRSIIDDSSNVGGMVLNSADNCIISGGLQLMNESGQMAFHNLEDLEDNVAVGDAIVTSNISNKYMPGILIGYISSIENDANNLTKSGTLTPVADFKHLQYVLVVMETKETGL